MVSSPGYVPLVQNEEKSNYTDHRQGHTLQQKNITKTKTERNGKKVNNVKLQIIYVINVSSKLYVEFWKKILGQDIQGFPIS